MQPSTDHSRRNQTINSRSELQAIKQDYHLLRNLSRDVRYTLVPIPDAELSRAIAAHESIYDHIASLLGEPPLHSLRESEEGNSDDLAPSDA